MAPVASTPTPPRPAGKTRPGARRQLAAPPHSIDPSLRYDWLKASEDTKYEGNGRNIFLAQAEIPQPVAPAKPTQKSRRQQDRLPAASAAHQPEVLWFRQQARRTEEGFFVSG